MKFKNLKAIGNWVVIKAVKSSSKKEKKEKETGIIMPGDNNPKGTIINVADGRKETSRLYVHSIGPEVKKDIKVGDEVIVDNYDIQTIGDDEDTYCIVSAEKVKCVVEAE